MKRRSIRNTAGVLALVTAAAALAGCATRPAGDPAAENAQLFAATDAWRAAYDSRDPRRITGLYADDAVLWGTTAKTIATSPAAIAEYFRPAPTRPTARVKFTEQHARLYGDVGFVSGYYTFSETRDGREIARPARFSFVMRRADAGWRIVHHHSSELPQ